MKQINVYFDDEEYVELIKEKKDMSWNKFIIFLSNSYNTIRNDLKGSTGEKTNE